MVTEQRDQKITYSTMSVEQAEAFNRAYDEALAGVMESLGKTYPAYIGGQPVHADRPTFEDRAPGDTRMLLGTFQDCLEPEVGSAVTAARRAFDTWSHVEWRERVGILRAAAENFRSRKYEISAWLTLEAGKPRLEAMGEVEEAADLITTYSDQIEQHNGYVIKLNQLTPEEVNHSVLRPYGVFGVIAPFNFPVALATGMIAGALLGGNAVVFKPSPWTPLSGFLVYQCLVDAGLPAGTLNLVTGSSSQTPQALLNDRTLDGVAFIGSRAVGCAIFAEFSRERPRPCIAEMGGKNPIIVTDQADLDKAIEGTVRAAFGYSGQKCSAASRAYVQREVADEYLRRLSARTEQVLVGNPVRPDVFMGPVINDGAYQRYQAVVATARRDGTVLAGGEVLRDGDLEYGYYCAPTVTTLPQNHHFFYEELFVPFLAVTTVDSLDEALRLANNSEFALTAGIFTENQEEMSRFLDRIEAGVVYVNRKSGATTGAWPGVQSFGGWKASGSTGKSALGPYYVQQFMHEQSQTVVS